MPDVEHTVATFRRADGGELRVLRVRHDDGEVVTRLRRYHVRDGELRAGQILSVLDHELVEMIDVLTRIARKSSAKASSGEQRVQPERRQSQHRTRDTQQRDFADIDEENLF